MPKTTDKSLCNCCGLPDRELVKGQCGRCWLLYGPPPEKPKNGKRVRSSGPLDHSAFNERLHFVATSRRVH